MGEKLPYSEEDVIAEHFSLQASASVDCCAYPTATELFPVYQKMQPALLSFLTTAMSMSVVGEVRSENGKPIKNIQLSVAPGGRPNIPVQDGAYSFLVSPGSLYVTG